MKISKQISIMSSITLSLFFSACGIASRQQELDMTATSFPMITATATPTFTPVVPTPSRDTDSDFFSP
jgi:hypothetical protein